MSPPDILLTPPPCGSRRRAVGLSGRRAPLPGRASRGAAGARGVQEGAAASGPAAHEPAAAATDSGLRRARPPAAAPPAPRPAAQAAAGDAGRQSLSPDAKK